MYFGGVEGGATHSMFMLCNSEAKVLAIIEGLGTNPYQLGLADTTHRIKDMVTKGFEAAGLPTDITLAGLGLSLSGCEGEEMNKELVNKFKELHPELSHHYAVCSDTIGTLLSASGTGGIVIISGTGSNSLLVNPDGTEARCGGWGHILGDEGGAFWIAQRAMKIYFDDLDNMGKRPIYPTAKVQETILNYFGVKDRYGLLTFCYDKFSKPHFAGLCKDLADIAHQGDKLAQHVFEEAGRALAQHIVALSPSFHSELVNRPGGVPIVCIGSVWKSWDLLKSGFLSELAENCSKFDEITLLKLKVPMATGACYLGADAAKLDYPKNYKDNTTVFFQGSVKQ